MKWSGLTPRRDIDLDAINARFAPRWHECRMVRCAAWCVLWIATFGVAVGVMS